MSETLQVFVLSDPTAINRRRRMEAMLSSLPSVTGCLFDTVSAESLPLPYDDHAAFLEHGSVMSSAERSCAAGHLAILETFIHDGRYDYALIIEDDIFLDVNFRFSAVASMMRRVEIEYLKLYSRFYCPSRYIASFRSLTMYRARWPPLGLQAYMVSKRGARRLREHVISLKSLTRPIDDIFDRFWETKLPVILLYPFPVLELTQPTLIHNKENRQVIDKRNAELGRSLIEPPRGGSKRETLQRIRADLELLSFDRGLAARLKKHGGTIYSELFE